MELINETKEKKKPNLFNLLSKNTLNRLNQEAAKRPPPPKPKVDIQVPREQPKEKKRFYQVTFVPMYNQNFQKEMESMMKAFDYFLKESNIQIREVKNSNQNRNPNKKPFYILLGKEPITNSTYAFSLIPGEKIEINQNSQFRNVSMIYFDVSPATAPCLNDQPHVDFTEFPVYRLQVNTNKTVKYCPENDENIKELIDLITGNKANLPNNISLSQSGSLLTNENIQKQKNQNRNLRVKVPDLETASIQLDRVNDLYYQLFQKNPKNTLYIKKAKIEEMFRAMDHQSTVLKPELFQAIRRIIPQLYVEENMLLTANYYLSEDGNEVHLTQNAMREYGGRFLEYYREKKNQNKNQAKNSGLKNYLLANEFIEKVRREDHPWMVSSTTIPQKTELENSFYLGFDFEYLLIRILKSQSASSSQFVVPFLLKNREDDGNGNYILYYLLVQNKKISLYPIYYQEKNMELLDKIHAKVDLYFQTIVSQSFLSRKPLSLQYTGTVRKNVDFKLAFLEPRMQHILFSHYHLFYQLLNSSVSFGKKPTDEMLIFITFLLELA